MKILILIASFISLTSMANNSPDNYELLPTVTEEVADRALECFYQEDFQCIEGLVRSGNDANFSIKGRRNIFNNIGKAGLMRHFNAGKPWTKITETQELILDFLILKGANPDRLSGSIVGLTPLYDAVIGNLEDFRIYPVNTTGYAQYLIKNGANVNKVSYSVTGWETAWGVLDMKSRPEVFDAIVAGGAQFARYGCKVDQGFYHLSRRYLDERGLSRELLFMYAFDYFHKALGAPNHRTNEWDFYDWYLGCK